MSAAIAEVERRVRGGVKGVASAEARVTSARTREEVARRAGQNASVLGVAGVVAAAAVGYGIYSVLRARRERQKPQNRLKRRVSQMRSELGGRVEKRVEQSRKQLEQARQRGLLLKLDPTDGGYLRVTDARLEPLDKKRGQTTVIKKLVWAGLLSAFMALGSVVARRVAGEVWRATVHEDPPTQKNQAASS
jgi:hypothetical protein